MLNSFCYVIQVFTLPQSWELLCRDNVDNIQSLSHVQLFAIPWNAAHQDSLSITNSQSLAKLTFIESVMSSNHLILCHPLLLPSIFPRIRIFPNIFQSFQLFAWGGQSIGVSASTSVLPVNYSGLISFRMDWFDLLAVQGTLESPPTPQFKASILWH